MERIILEAFAHETLSGLKTEVRTLEKAKVQKLERSEIGVVRKEETVKTLHEQENSFKKEDMSRRFKCTKDSYKHPLHWTLIIPAWVA